MSELAFAAYGNNSPDLFSEICFLIFENLCRIRDDLSVTFFAPLLVWPYFNLDHLKIDMEIFCV